MEILKLILRLRQSIGLQASISRILERHLLILFGSRFSWSYVPRHLFLLSSLEILLILKDQRPRGALLALRSAASFYLGGKVVNVAGPGM
jgi:hypothetical protein